MITQENEITNRCLGVLFLPLKLPFQVKISEERKRASMKCTVCGQDFILKQLGSLSGRIFLWITSAFGKEAFVSSVPMEDCCMTDQWFSSEVCHSNLVFFRSTQVPWKNLEKCLQVPLYAHSQTTVKTAKPLKTSCILPISVSLLL